MASDLHGKKSIPVERLLTPLRVIFCVALISKELSFQTAQRIGQLEFFLCPFYSFMSGERGEGGVVVMYAQCFQLQLFSTKGTLFLKISHVLSNWSSDLCKQKSMIAFVPSLLVFLLPILISCCYLHLRYVIITLFS